MVGSGDGIGHNDLNSCILPTILPISKTRRLC